MHTSLDIKQYLVKAKLMVRVILKIPQWGNGDRLTEEMNPADGLKG